MRRRKREFSRWLELLDGDGDCVARADANKRGRKDLEDRKDWLEKQRPCGKYRIVERKVR